MDHDERRTHKRFLLQLPASVIAESATGPASRCHVFTRDISSDGAFLYMPVQHPLGADVTVSLSLSFRNPSHTVGLANISVRGMVVRVELWGMATRFLEPCEITPANLESGVGLRQ